MTMKIVSKIRDDINYHSTQEALSAYKASITRLQQEVRFLHRAENIIDKFRYNQDLPNNRQVLIVMSLTGSPNINLAEYVVHKLGIELNLNLLSGPDDKYFKRPLLENFSSELKKYWAFLLDR